MTVLAKMSARISALGGLKRIGLNASRRIGADTVCTYVMACADGNVRYEPWPMQEPVFPTSSKF